MAWMLLKSCKKAQLLLPAICHPEVVVKKDAPRMVRRLTVVTDTPVGSAVRRVHAWRVEWVLESENVRRTSRRRRHVRRTSKVRRT
jgi:hypothetical protein